MLCAKYDYKMDIAVKKEEAFEEGVKEAKTEAAKRFYANKVPINTIANSLGMTEEEILDIVRTK